MDSVNRIKSLLTTDPETKAAARKMELALAAEKMTLADRKAIQVWVARALRSLAALADRGELTDSAVGVIATNATPRAPVTLAALPSDVGGRLETRVGYEIQTMVDAVASRL